jgi:hypothetical protein
LASNIAGEAGEYITQEQQLQRTVLARRTLRLYASRWRPPDDEHHVTTHGVSLENG